MANDIIIGSPENILECTVKIYRNSHNNDSLLSRRLKNNSRTPNNSYMKATS